MLAARDPSSFLKHRDTSNQLARCKQHFAGVVNQLLNTADGAFIAQWQSVSPVN